MKSVFACSLVLTLVGAAVAREPARLELVESRKIWDQAPHSAFGDLTRHKDEWFCTFREGKEHVSPDGALRVLSSKDGKTWESAALIRMEGKDLRDPHFAAAPDGRLMLVGAAATREPDKPSLQSMAWYSADGRDWGRPIPVGEPGWWLWRVTWHGKTAFGVGYSGADRATRLYRSEDGRKFEPIVSPLFDKGMPNEATLLFLPDETCLCLQRRDFYPQGKSPRDRTGQLGRSRPPYTSWTWADLGVQLGGPNLTRLPSGRIVVASRYFKGKERGTVLYLLNRDGNKLTDPLVLPSGGDSSYAGLVWHDGQLWVSYYSTHEGKANIYLARVKVHGE